MLFPVRYADGRKRVRRLHALGYAGRSPCRCFSPVLIRKKRRVTPCAVASISRKPTCWLAIPTGLKVTPFPSVLQLLSESCRTARSTNHIPSQISAKTASDWEHRANAAEQVRTLSNAHEQQRKSRR